MGTETKKELHLSHSQISEFTRCPRKYHLHYRLGLPAEFCPSGLLFGSAVHEAIAISVAEKTHWRDRIAARIDRRIETLVARQDPVLLQRVSEEARHKAYESLGIQAQQQELEAIQKEKEEIERRERRLVAEQKAAINGTTVEQELERGGYYRYDSDVDNAVKARAKALEADILAESDLGKQVLALREEKDNLLDTVWLATSSSQIKELWEQVNTLLEVTPTALEEKALQIEPVQDP